ncbi:hypothetical protein [Arthrobacter ramosus]|uniref:Uncharacterized protein n=1 Tax=Arthrobacter ramosus TaxID=1672 RepID=A0ABV5XWP4_ARTRM|nr:hypothetical protein [Arthrobacter ramosus]
MESSSQSVHITVSDAALVDEFLTEAVESLMKNAAANNCGILVTRHSQEIYTADVNPHVPFGITREISRL